MQPAPEDVAYKLLAQLGQPVHNGVYRKMELRLPIKLISKNSSQLA